MAIKGCASRLLMRALFAAGIGVLGSSASLAAGDVSPKSWAYRNSTGTGTNDLFPTAAQACQRVFPEDRFLRAATDSENRVQCFFRHAKEGYDFDTNAVSRVAVCPENARSEDSGNTCTCESNFEASGGKCVASGDRPAASSRMSDASGSDNCQLDRLKGDALKKGVVTLVQRYTDESNRALINKPKESAESVPSVGKGFFTGDYGTLLENLVAQRVHADTCLSKFVRHLSAAEQSKRAPGGEKGSHPDFQGIGIALRALQIDITTEEEKARKLATDGAKTDYVFIVYERGLCLDAKTRVAVTIPKGADRTKIKNGLCPQNWK